MRGTIAPYGPVHWLDYNDTHAIMCTWYYASCCIQQTWNQTAKCTSLHAPKYALKYTPDCTRLYTPSLLDLRSQDAPKYTPSTLPSTLPGMLRSEVHSWWHSTVHSQPAWLTLSRWSQVNSKDAPNCTRCHTPSLLDCTLPSKLSRRSEAHSRACSQVHSQLHSVTHSQPAWLYAPK